MAPRGAALRAPGRLPAVAACCRSASVETCSPTCCGSTWIGTGRSTRDSLGKGRILTRGIDFGVALGFWTVGVLSAGLSSLVPLPQEQNATRRMSARMAWRPFTNGSDRWSERVLVIADFLHLSWGIFQLGPARGPVLRRLTSRPARGLAKNGKARSCSNALRDSSVHRRTAP